MTVDGRKDLFHYTFLSRNGYLDKFKAALGLPNLTVPFLAALLKTFNKIMGLKGFITKDEYGNDSLYYKETLNKILGMTDDGRFCINPKQNPNLQKIHNIIDYWDMKEYERENPRQTPQEEIPSYESDEEDMQKVSDELIRQGNLNEMKKGKKIHITESQYKELKKRLTESYFVEPEKVRIVKKFLDDNFIRGALPAIGEDGYAKPILIVAMNIPYSEEKKNMTAKQLFYLLQDKFNKIYADPKQRDAFLKKMMVDWYYNKITKDGLLSSNNY